MCSSPPYILRKFLSLKSLFLIIKNLHDEFLHPDHILTKITKTIQMWYACQMTSQRDAWTEFYLNFDGDLKRYKDCGFILSSSIK